jgi:hypothetical protein
MIKFQLLVKIYYAGNPVIFCFHDHGHFAQLTLLNFKTIAIGLGKNCIWIF